MAKKIILEVTTVQQLERRSHTRSKHYHAKYSPVTKAQEAHLKSRIKYLVPAGSFTCRECEEVVTPEVGQRKHSLASSVHLLCGFCNEHRLEPLGG